MYYRCDLLVEGERYHVTDDLENWDEVKASFKRADYDGVVRTFSNEFSFSGDARRVLLKEYGDRYLDAAASVTLSTRNNSWLYSERFNCALNFSTLRDDGRTVRINAVDDGVASLIKAGKGTQYEYPVEGLREAHPLLYTGLDISCRAEWTITGSYYDPEAMTGLYIPYGNSDRPSFITVYVTSSDSLVNRGAMFGDVSGTEAMDVGEDGTVSGSVKDQSPFFESLDGRFDVTLDIYFRSKVKVLDTNGRIILAKRKAGKLEYIKETAIEGIDFTAFEYGGTVSLSTGDALFLLFKSDRADNDLQIDERSEIRMTAEWTNRIADVEMDVIRPVTLLNRLLKSMNGERDGLTGVIEPSGEPRLDNCMILAAESARRIPGARIYTSFSKFSQWMSFVFGYAYDISGSVVTFRHRSRYFSDTVVKRIDSVSDYGMSVNSSLVYSRVRIGYGKKEYDTANGRDEFRFTNEYSTGVTMTDNTLEMVSPYRADAYGIEFLADKAGEDTTDDDSDTDVFFVCAEYNPEPDDTQRPTPNAGLYTLTNAGLSVEGVISPDTMFNVMYSPSSMVTANTGYICASAGRLAFSSSEGNGNVVIGGLAENRDIVLSGRLFTVSEVEFETSDTELPDDLSGIVEAEWNGRTVRGYYKQADYSFTKSRGSRVVLIVKDAESLQIPE